MNTLPPLRRKILTQILKIIFIFFILAFALIFTVQFSIFNPDQRISASYQFIHTIDNMEDIVDSIYQNKLTDKQRQNLMLDLDNKIIQVRSENKNTKYEEDTEKILQHLENIKTKKTLQKEEYLEFKKSLRKLSTLNKVVTIETIKNRFAIARGILFSACFIFMITLIVSIYLSEQFSSNIVQPLKKMTEVLQNNPQLNQKLKFPEPNSLELKILIMELSDLWERLRDAEQVHLKKLDAQRKDLEAILSSIKDAILVLDDEGIVRHMNKGFYEFLGASEQESLLYWKWEDLPLSTKAYLDLRETTRPDDFKESVLIQNKNDKIHYFLVRKNKILDESGNATGFIVVLHNINSTTG
jgi:PAS domain S-box-containing protein